MCANSRMDLLLAADRGWLQYHTMTLPIRATAACTVGDSVWIGDYVGKIHAYSLVSTSIKIKLLLCYKKTE